MLIRFMKIDGFLSIVILSLLLLCVEMILFFIADIILYKLEYPDSDVFLQTEISHSPIYLIYKNTITLYLLRLLFYTPVVVGALFLLRKFGLLESSVAVAVSNILVYVFVSWVLSLVFAFARDYFVFGRPYYKNAFFYICILSAGISPLLLLPALRLFKGDGH